LTGHLEARRAIFVRRMSAAGQDTWSVPVPLSSADYRRNRLVLLGVAGLLTAAFAGGQVAAHDGSTSNPGRPANNPHRRTNNAHRPASSPVRRANDPVGRANTAGRSTHTAGRSTNTAGRSTHTAGRSTHTAHADRCQPPPGDAFGYHCGQVEHNPRIRLIFWGKWGKKWALQRTAVTGAVSGFFTWLPYSPYQTLLNQYYDKSGHIGLDPKLVSTTFDTATSPPQQVPDQAVIDEVSRLISYNGWPSGGVNNQYVVITPPGSSSQDTTSCGWHENVGAAHPLMLIYVPYPNAICRSGQPASDVIGELSHDEIEVQTDPVGSGGWFGIPHLSSVGASMGQVLFLSDPSHEVGDLCHAVTGPSPIAQPISFVWDMRAGMCATSTLQGQQARGGAARAAAGPSLQG
jgi:hypothetical protein